MAGMSASFHFSSLLSHMGEDMSRWEYRTQHHTCFHTLSVEHIFVHIIPYSLLLCFVPDFAEVAAKAFFKLFSGLFLFLFWKCFTSAVCGGCLVLC